VQIDSSHKSITVTPPSNASTSKTPSPTEATFDYIFDESAPQSQVYYLTTSRIASDVLSGINSTLISYGQTGTGKTHTMMGVGGGVSEDSSVAEDEAENKKDDDDASLISSIQPYSIDEEVTD